MSDTVLGSTAMKCKTQPLPVGCPLSGDAHRCQTIAVQNKDMRVTKDVPGTKERLKMEPVIVPENHREGFRR